jgi:NTP pyrophosphatase (non-canonical NTP hydrolase)
MKGKQMSYAELEMKVVQWSEARKIIPRSTPLAQSHKTLEEVGELIDAAAKLQLLEQLKDHLPAEVYFGNRTIIMDELRDAVGDVAVTLINACALADVDLTDCLAGAYDTIKDRRGELREDGKFYKE